MRAYRKRKASKRGSTLTATVPLRVKPRERPVVARVAKQLPLPDFSVLDASGITWTNHAKERMDERGIGIYEAIAAVLDPRETYPYLGKTTVYVHIRGDIKVAYDPWAKEIVTVAGRNEDDDSRTPMNTWERKDEVDEVMPTIGERLTEEQKKAAIAASFKPPSDNGKPAVKPMSAGDCLDEFAETAPPGTEIGLDEFFERYESNLLAQYTDKRAATSNLSAAASHRAGKGKIIRSGRGRIKVPEPEKPYRITSLKRTEGTREERVPSQPTHQEPVPASMAAIKTAWESTTEPEEERPVSAPPAQSTPAQDIVTEPVPAKQLVRLEKDPEPYLPEPWAPQGLAAIKSAFYSHIMPAIWASGVPYRIVDENDEWHVIIMKPKEE